MLFLLYLGLGVLVPGTAQGDYARPAPSNNVAGNAEEKGDPQEPVAYPPAFDWRNVGGYNYVTPIKDQTQKCASCTVFAVIAALEANARIRLKLPENVSDNIEIDFSEAQLFFCNRRTCKSGWVAYKALDYSRRKGVVSENAQPYELESCCTYAPAEEDGLAECTDCCSAEIDKYVENAQITQISSYTRMKSPEKMKQWIALKGPLVTNMVVEYDSFLSYKQGTIYRCPRNIAKPLNHAVCCIGYDEHRQAWLCKNSFGTKWGMEGYFWIGYGECGVDRTMFGINGFTQIYPQTEELRE